MNPKRRFQALGLLLLCSLAGTAQAGSHWEWRDAQGKVVFSDRPPPGHVAEKDILVRPGGAVRSRSPMAVPAAVAASGGSAAPTAEAGAPIRPAVATEDPALAARKREADQAAEVKRKAEEARIAQARSENCTRARGYQKTLDDGVKIVRANDKGEREVLDDTARAKEAARTREVIDRDCPR